MKNKSGIKVLKILSLIFIAVSVAFGSAMLCVFETKKDNNNQTPNSVHYNTLALNQEFTNNPYVVVGENVYSYLQLQDMQNQQPNQTAPLVTTPKLTFDDNGKLELVFYKNLTTSLTASNFIELADANIASQFQATKNEDGSINIQIIDLTDVVNITTSDDADYTLYSLAFSTEATLNFANGEFSVGEKKGSTSLTATSKTDAQILNLANGSFKFSGEKTYSPKTTTTEVDGSLVTTVTEGRAFLQTGGTLTLEDITLDGFWLEQVDGALEDLIQNLSEDMMGGAILSLAGTLNLNCNIINCISTLGAGVASLETLNVTGGNYYNNYAIAGSCLGTLGGIVNVTGGNFYNNVADYAGATLANLQGVVNIEDCNIYNNFASYGAIVTMYGNTTINGGNFFGNYGTAGSVLMAADYSTLTINDGDFYNNFTNWIGGVVNVCPNENGVPVTFTVNGGNYHNNYQTEDVSFTISDSVAQRLGVSESSKTITISPANDVMGYVFFVHNSPNMYGYVGSSTSTFNLNGGTYSNNVPGDAMYPAEIFLGDAEYITLGAELTQEISVIKPQLKSMALGDTEYAYIAYSEDVSVLESGLEFLKLINLPEKNQLSINEKENYIVCGKYNGAGLYDIDTGEVVFTWNELVANEKVRVSDSTLISVNRGLTGRLVVSDDITAIRDEACRGMSISIIELPDSVESIGKLAFSDSVSGENIALRTIKIGSGIKFIDELAFFNCVLTDLYLKDLKVWCEASITDSSSPTFHIKNLYVNNEQVTEVVIPEGTTSINAYTFEGMTPVTKIIIPSTVTYIDSRAFNARNNVEFIVNENNTSYASLDGVLFNKDYTTLVRYPEAKDGNYTVPNTVINIGDCAFFSTTNIDGIIFNNSITTIGSYAFAYSHIPGPIVMPNSITSLGEFAFWLAEVENVTLSDNITKLEYRVFSSCDKLKSINMPKSLTVIGNGAFVGCESLTIDLVIPDSVTTIEAVAFGGCTGLTSLVIGSGVNIIQGMAFNGCSGLTSVVLKSPFTHFENQVFEDCINVLSYDFSSATSVHTLTGSYVFSGINDNCKIYVPQRLYSSWITAQYWTTYKDYIVPIKEYGLFDKSTGNLIYSWQELIDKKYITIEGTTITNFNGDLVGKLVIKEGITAIADSAFRERKIVEIEFPASLVSVDPTAFVFCINLENFIVEPGNKYLSTDNGVLYNYSQTELIFYPAKLSNTSYTILNTTKIIDIYAFAYNEYLRSITIPASIVSMEKYAFVETCIENVYITDLVAWCNIVFESELANPLYSFSPDNPCSKLYLNNELITDLVIPAELTQINACAFAGAECLTSVTIPSSVTSIGDGAFYLCENILSYDFISAKSVPTIDEWSLVGINDNCKIYVPQDLYDSWISAPYWSNYKKYIVGVENSGLFNAAGQKVYTWDELVSNKLVTVNDTKLTDVALETTYSDHKLVISNEITTIGGSAFTGVSIAELEIPTSVTIIEDGAFLMCHLTNIVLPDSVTTLGSQAFAMTPELKSVTLSNSLVELGDSLFIWSGITSITIPASVNSIFSNTFDGATNLAEIIVVTGNRSFSSYNGVLYNYNKSTLVKCPEGYNGSYSIYGSTTTIADSAFRSCSSLTSITIPNSVTTIGEGSFGYCRSLISINIPNSVKTIGAYAFEYCTKMTGVVVGNGLTSIGDYAFSHMHDSNLSIGYVNFYFVSATKIPTLGLNVFNYTFINDSSGNPINYIYVSPSLYDSWIVAQNWSVWANHITALNDGGLYNATTGEQIYSWDQLKSNGYISISGTTITSFNTSLSGRLVIASSISSIGNSAFSSCTGLTAVEISNSVSNIGQYAFRNCTSLKNIKIGSSVGSINYYAFDNCTSLTAVYIDNINNWTQITFNNSLANPLYYAGNLYIDGNLATEVVIKNAVNDYAFYNATCLTEAYISGDSIGYQAFYNCSKLRNLSLGNLVSDIRTYAFYNCTALTTVEIPAGITNIGDYAFAYCSNVTKYDFTNHTTIPNLGTSVFNDINDACLIWVPSNLYYAWIMQTNWSNWSYYIYTEGLEEDPAGLYDMTTGVKIYNWGLLIAQEFIYVENTTLASINQELTSMGIGVYKLVVADYITEIAEQAFYGCGVVGEIELPTSVRTIGKYAFLQSISLQKVTIPKSVTYIGEGAFAMCSILNQINVNSANANYSSANGVLFNKNKTTLICYPAGKSGVYTIPTSVTEIFAGAFACATGLTSVTIPSSVTTIGYGAFALCTLVTLYDFTNHTTVPTIAENVFQNINSTAVIYVPTSLYYTWRESTNWTEWKSYIYADGIVLSPGLYSNVTGDLMYSWAELVSKGIITLNGTTISSVKISSMVGKLIMSNDITNIAPGAFNGCDGLTSVTLSSNLVSIGDMAFAMCTYIPSISIPATVTSIGVGVFAGCVSLEELTVDSANEKYTTENNVLFNKTKTVLIGFANAKAGSYTIPSTVVQIADYGMAYAANITNLTIPDSVTSIGMCGLAMCSGLTYLTIPSSVTNINDMAFAMNSNIREYNFKSHTIIPTIGQNVFMQPYMLLKIYVPAVLYNDWKVETNWSNWASYIYTERLEINTGVAGVYDNVTGVLLMPWNDVVASGVISVSGSTISSTQTLEGQGEYYLVIPEGITTINAQCFASCTALGGLHLPSTLKSVGMACFVYTYINEINIPAACTSIGMLAFAGSLACTAINVDPANTAYSSDAGVLFNKNKSTLITYPTGRGGTYSIPNSCITISDYSFVLSAFLTSVTIPTSVLEIGSSAFYGSGISGRLVIPNGVTTISASAFSDCSGLSQVVLGNKVTSIGEHAFNGCTELTSITIPDTLTTLGTAAFSGCTKLTGTINIPGVKSIPVKAFYGLSNITAVILSDKLTSIGESAFENCSSLNGSLVIPDSCTSIGQAAFRGTNYTTILLGNGITSVSNYVFQNCKSLTNITFGNKVTYIGLSAFSGCTNLTGMLTIPESVNTISNYAFQDCSSITALKLGSNVQTIGDLAFYNCSRIAGVLSLPNSLTTIGQSAFRNCSSFTGTLTIPANVTSIGTYAFRDCSGFSALTIGNNVTTISDQAFYNCTGLTRLTMGTKVQTIGANAFQNCSNITGTLTIPNSCTIIGNNAFQNCIGFTEISMGTNVQSIGDLAFYGCTNLSGSLSLPSSLTSIGQTAFRDCTKLTGTLTIGNNVTTIGPYAFQNCTGFTRLVIGTNVQTIGDLAFYNCTGLTSLAFNSTKVTTIGVSALRGLTKVTGTVTLPNSLTTIGDFAFHSATGITKFTFGSSLASLGAGAFANCTSVTMYDFSAATRIPTLSNMNCFNGITTSCQIVVPSSLYSSWIAASNWADRAEYIVSTTAVNNTSVVETSLSLLDAALEANTSQSVVLQHKDDYNTDDVNDNDDGSSGNDNTLPNSINTKKTNDGVVGVTKVT